MRFDPPGTIDRTILDAALQPQDDNTDIDANRRLSVPRAGRIPDRDRRVNDGDARRIKSGIRPGRARGRTRRRSSAIRRRRGRSRSARGSTASPASRRTTARPDRSPSCSTPTAAACASPRFVPYRRSPGSTAWTRPSSGSISKATVFPTSSARAPRRPTSPASRRSRCRRWVEARRPILAISTIGCCARRRRCRWPSTGPLPGRWPGRSRAAANGDYPGADNYWSVAVLPLTHQTVKKVTIDPTKPDMFFVDPANPDFGFKINSTHGVTAADVTASERRRVFLDADLRGRQVRREDFLTFSNLAVPNAEPLITESMPIASRAGPSRCCSRTARPDPAPSSSTASCR